MRLNVAWKRLRTLAFIGLTLTASTLRAGVNVWTTFGPPGAKINSLVFSPSNSALIFAVPHSLTGYPTRGIFRSTDSGLTWQLQTAGLPSDYLATLAIDPSDSNTAYLAYYLQGIYKTLDGGVTWQRIKKDSNTAYVFSFLIDSATPSTVYFGSYTGVSKSTDAGTSWNTVSLPVQDYIQSLTIDPGNSSHVLVGTSYYGIYSSLDGGGTWFPANVGLPPHLSVTSLLFDSSQSSTIYAVSLSSGIFKSTDGGASWLLSAAGIAGFSVYTLALDSATSSLFAGTDGGSVYRSTDGGVTWTPSAAGISSSTILSIAVDPQTIGHIVAGGYGGVFASNDAGLTWADSLTGMSRMDVSSIAIQNGSSSIYYAGTYGGGVFKTTDGGTTWARANAGIANTNVISLAADPLDAFTVIAGTEGGLYRTTDGGASWLLSGIAATGVYSVTYQPGSSSVLYAGTSPLAPAGPAILYKSTDSGFTWTSISGGLPTGAPVSSIAIDPSNSSNIYVSAGSVFAYSYGTGGVYRSINGGVTWASTLFNEGDAYCLGANPSFSTLYAGSYQDFATTTDSGDTWHSISYAYLGDCIEIDPSDPSTLYLGDFDGSLSKLSTLGQGQLAFTLPGNAVLAVRLVPGSSGTLMAGTADGGFSTLTQAAPTVASISPSFGSVNGGNAITITGSGFMLYPAVSIGGIPATSVTFVDQSTIQAVTGPHAAGLADVTVLNPTLLSATLPGAFSYQCAEPFTATVSGGGTICEGDSAQFGANFTGIAPWTVMWSDGVQQTSPYGSVTRTVSPPATTTYTISSVTDGSGCGPGVAFGGALVTVQPIPAAPVITVPTIVAPLSSGIVASVPFHEGALYFWQIDSGTIQVQALNQISFSVGYGASTVTISVTEETAAGCYSPVGTAEVTVGFLDVPTSNPFHDFISTLANDGVSVGCGGDYFCPNDAVLRSSMAIFLLRSKYWSSYTPPPATGIFGDVPASNPFAPWIEEIFNEGITGGCSTNPLNYCPASFVTRAQMAVLLLRAKYWSGYSPPPATGLFADVPASNPFAPWIEELYNEGITGGCSATPLLYCPSNPVTREQMAVFLVVTFNLP